MTLHSRATYDVNRTALRITGIAGQLLLLERLLQLGVGITRDPVADDPEVAGDMVDGLLRAAQAYTARLTEDLEWIAEAMRTSPAAAEARARDVERTGIEITSAGRPRGVRGTDTAGAA